MDEEQRLRGGGWGKKKKERKRRREKLEEKNRKEKAREKERKEPYQIRRGWQRQWEHFFIQGDRRGVKLGMVREEGWAELCCTWRCSDTTRTESSCTEVGD